MAQQTSLDRLNRNKGIVHSKFNIALKKIIHPFLLKLADSKIGYKIVKCCQYSGKTIEFSKERPLIFVCNHGTPYDIPIALKAIKEHTILFAGKQPLEKIDELFFNLNGTIYVDRKDKKDKGLSKDAMILTLKNKRNILVFPEGTWNMTDSSPMHEMPWGIIEVAKEANALIVPMALDYDYDTRVCKYKIGDPIDVRDSTLKDGIDCVRDAVATLRWDLFEAKGQTLRTDIDVELEREKIMHSIDEYPKLDYEYEKSVVFHSKPQAEEVFEPIKKIGR